jgi:Uncharacterized protein conserved in bacteria (DUF2330)
MRRLRLLFPFTALASVLLVGAPAFACGGLVAPNGTVQLVKTTTLAAYHEGIEHYVTSFEFAGGEGEFGSIIPLPGVPTDVIRGGDWTLQRLVLETQPQPEAVAFAAAGAALDAERATVILKTKIDALDVVVLEGGAVAVGNWAREHGFLLPPDAPEVLEFYAKRSPIFMTVRFDASRAAEQGLAEGDGTPVHVVIPTTNPWVPLRILGLGAPADAPIEADVYLLTDRDPAMLPVPLTPGISSRLPSDVRPGLVLEASQPASRSLLTDLRSDKGMEWLPRDGMWLTYLRVDSRAGELVYDLAIDASGAGQPSPRAAGLEPDPIVRGSAFERFAPVLWTALAVLVTLGALGMLDRRRAGRPAV